MAVVKDILLYGTFAARPAASSSNDGKLYRATDTGKTYQSDGSSWTLVADNAAISGVITDWKESVRAATTADITLSGAQTIDGVSVIAGDRVLVKNQSTGADNGIYVAAAGAWARAADADSSADVTGNMAVFVEEGTVAADKIYILTTNNPITLGSTALTFTALTSGGAGSDTTAIHVGTANEISGITEKTSLADDDLFVIEDSAASYVKKKVKKSNVGGSSGTPIMEQVWAYIAANNTNPIDTLISSGNYRVFIYFDTYNAAGWKAATNATYTVPVGKKLVVMNTIVDSLLPADSASRRARFYNSTDAADIIPYNYFYTNGIVYAEGSPTKMKEVAAGKTCRLEIWNVDTNTRASGGVVVCVEV